MVVNWDDYMGYDEGRGERKGQCCGGRPMTVEEAAS